MGLDVAGQGCRRWFHLAPEDATTTSSVDTWHQARGSVLCIYIQGAVPYLSGMSGSEIGAGKLALSLGQEHWSKIVWTSFSSPEDSASVQRIVLYSQIIRE